MREILFRGKTEDGEWVYGYYIKAEHHWHEKGIHEDWIITRASQNGGWVTLQGRHAVIPETVGQYIGLTDKNGKKIFEGDYIVCRQAIEGNFIDEHIEMGYVEMKHGAFGLHRKQGYYRPFKDWLEDYEYEVLGNIHDNPELIGGDKQ